MLEPFIRKLEYGADLSDQDRYVLEKMVCQVRAVGPRQDLIKEGDRPDSVHLILSGYACRYKMLEGGKRQIMAWLVPGDLCDLHVAILGEMDHSIATLAQSQVAYVPKRTIEDLTSNHPAINRALWWATLVDEGTLREWLVNMGQRPADKQMAHLFCELFVRLQSVGLADDDGMEFPLTQDELADTLGMTAVHVNRMLQKLRNEVFISLEDKRLIIRDFDRLREFAEFNPNYLHLTKRLNNGIVAQANAALSAG